MTAEAEAADEERQNLCLEVLQLYGDPEVFGLCSSLSQERRRHFLSSFQDFLEDKYRDLFLLATSRLRGHPVLGKPDVKASKTPGFEPSIATIRRCRRGSPQSVLYPPGAFGITRPLQVLLGPAVGRTDPTVIQEMEVKHIPQFGKQAWGHDLFEKQKELASELWRSSAMGSSPHLTELVRRRPCGQRDSGQRIAPGKLARIQASEITPFFYPEEAAACSITLVTDPATSPTGQIMTIARDGEGALERVFLDNQLPAAGAFLNDVAQARFAKGNKLDIMEPILVVHRDGLRGIAVRPDEARRLVTLGIHPADARAMGNKAVASQQYWAAAEFYCAGLQHAEMDIIATLLSNRCQAYLKTREYAAAVCDAAAVLQMRFHEAKAWARYAQALRGLGAELLASRVDAADDDAPSFTEGVAEWQRVTFASVMAAARLAAEGTYSLSKASSLVAAKRAVETAKEAANDKYKQGDFVAAVQGYTKALACDPAIEDAAAIFGNLAHCRLCLAQPHCAIAAAAACLRLLPSGAVAMKAAHRLAGAVACTGELSLAESVAKLFDALPLDAPTAEAARRQCEKLVRHRELLERLQEGAVTGEDEVTELLQSTIPVDFCGPVQFKGEGLCTTRNVCKGTLLLIARPLGGAATMEEALTLVERTSQRLRHSETLRDRLSYLCSVDLAAKEVLRLLASSDAAAAASSGRALLLSNPRPQLLPLLGQRAELFCLDLIPPVKLDQIIEKHRESPEIEGDERINLLGSLKASFSHSFRDCGDRRALGIYPALSACQRAAETANCISVRHGDGIAVLAADELQCEQILLLETKGISWKLMEYHIH